MSKKCVFISGGARSGKSQFAQELAGSISDKVLFVATAEAGDEEMRRRIEKHRESRPASWQTLEATRNLASRIQQEIGGKAVVLIDCITLLVSNILGDSCSRDGRGAPNEDGRGSDENGAHLRPRGPGQGRGCVETGWLSRHAD